MLSSFLTFERTTHVFMPRVLLICTLRIPPTCFLPFLSMRVSPGLTCIGEKRRSPVHVHGVAPVPFSPTLIIVGRWTRNCRRQRLPVRRASSDAFVAPFLALLGLQPVFLPRPPPPRLSSVPRYLG